MKKAIIPIFIVILILILFLLAHYTISTYFSQADGNVNFSVAKPICRAIIQDSCIYISNYEQKPLYFSICNFDEEGNVTEVGMQYTITIQTAQLNAPLKYKLYKINSDNSEENIKISTSEGNIKTISALTMGTSKEIHGYKLEIEYDSSSNIALDKNIGFSITLDSEQVISNK